MTHPTGITQVLILDPNATLATAQQLVAKLGYCLFMVQFAAITKMQLKLAVMNRPADIEDMRTMIFRCER